MHVLFQMVSKLMVVSSQAILILDSKTMQLKYRIPLSLISKVSTSPYQDKLVVFHLTKVREITSLLDPAVREITSLLDSTVREITSLFDSTVREITTLFDCGVFFQKPVS